MQRVKPSSELKRYFPFFLAGMLVATGIFWSFQRGGLDFSVFYHAWNLVAHGQGSEIYVNSPDRFLYAPGFAWVLAPVGLLPQTLAFALWNLLKAVAVFLMIEAFSSRLRDTSGSGRTIAVAGLILCARPFLIDFQYGQVNILILAICCWALFSYFDHEKSDRGNASPAVAWFFLGLMATSKVFAFPLLLLPWFRPSRGSRVRRIAIVASISGIVMALFLPIVTMGPTNGLSMLGAWATALAGKGFPLETHNQSFAALMAHYLTDAPTHVIALGSKWVVLGNAILSPDALAEIAMAWSFLTGSLLLGWMIFSEKVERLRWIAVVIGLLIVPLYLVWKPYFVLSYPLAVVMLSRYRKRLWPIILVGFCAMNLTGFDILGGALAARIEAASIFLLVHLAYLSCVIWAKPDRQFQME